MDGEPGRKVAGEVDLAAITQRRARGEDPGAELGLDVCPAMRLVEFLKPIGCGLEILPALFCGGGLRLGAGEDHLHRIGEHTKLRPAAMQRHDKCMLVGACVLMLVADDDRITPGHTVRDRRMPGQQACHPLAQQVVPFWGAPCPSADILRQAKGVAVGAGDLDHEPVDRANLDVAAETVRPAGKDVAGGIGVSQNEQSSVAEGGRDVAGVAGALISLAAAARRLDDHEARGGAKRLGDRRV